MGKIISPLKICHYPGRSRVTRLVPYTTTLVTFETRQQHVYRAPFISEDRNFDLSTALFHVTMSHGKSVQVPIRL